MTTIQDNYFKLKADIERVAHNAGRDPSRITLVAVTKTASPEEILEVLECGVTDIGENKVQDALGKQSEISLPVNWHFIGHLQTNKVKHVVGRFELLHSVDSVRLARTIDAEAAKKGLCQKLLFEVNISGEQSKTGFQPDEIRRDFEIISAMSNIDIQGLMTMAPFTSDQDLIRQCFRKLRLLENELMARTTTAQSLHHLSMGMTNDYRIGIEEGATMVRIGTALFHTP